MEKGDGEFQDGFASVRASWPVNFLVNFLRFLDSNGEILRSKKSLFMWLIAGLLGFDSHGMKD